MELRGLDYDFDLVNKAKHRIYYNKERNVAIFADMDYDGEIPDVFNWTPDEPYDRIISFLNNNNDVIVYWYKVEGTTSDYVVCPDCNYKDGWNITKLRKYIREFSDSEYYHYKYTIIKDNEIARFEPENM